MLIDIEAEYQYCTNYHILSCLHVFACIHSLVQRFSAAASWLKGKFSATRITGGLGDFITQGVRPRKCCGWVISCMGQGTDFFSGILQSPQLEGGGQLWKPVRDHEIQGVLMRCSWHLGEVCSSSCLAERFSSCGVGRVISNAAFMTHLWLIP